MVHSDDRIAVGAGITAPYEEGEAFQAAADGQATKIIIPSEIQKLAGLAAGIKESL